MEAGSRATARATSVCSVDTPTVLVFSIHTSIVIVSIVIVSTGYCVHNPSVLVSSVYTPAVLVSSVTLKQGLCLVSTIN